jgi:ribosomal protein L35AE/L33A
MEESRMRSNENRLLRRLFEPKRDEVTEEWRKLHNEKLNDSYCSPNIVRVIRSGRVCWAGLVARIGERRGVVRVLVEKPERNRPLRTLGRIWEDNIKMDLQDVGCGFKNWIDLAQDRGRWQARVNVVMNRVP